MRQGITTSDSYSSHPAKAGLQNSSSQGTVLDSGFRRNDDVCVSEDVSNGKFPHASSSRFLQAHSPMSRQHSKINKMGMSHSGRICGTEFGRST